MPDRDDAYRRFGPLLLEAVVLVFIEKINILRREQGMSVITEQEIIDSINNHLSELAPYYWMNGGT